MPPVLTPTRQGASQVPDTGPIAGMSCRPRFDTALSDHEWIDKLPR